MASLGMSSRGHEDEKEMLIADLLHQEQHLAEAIQKNPNMANSLGRELDKTRATRQKAVQLWTGGSHNSDIWCATKHSIEATRRSQELLENTARLNPEQMEGMAEVAHDVADIKENVKKHFLKGKSGGGCKRCAGDLSYIIDEGETNQDDSSDGKSNIGWILLFAVAGGLAVYALCKLSSNQDSDF